MAFYSETTIPIIEGQRPGLLDPTQPSRLLRSPTSHLLFATYDATTACAALPGVDMNPGTAKGRRVVIETNAATWTCSWRFVPAAKIEPGADGDEGIWPRLVNFCGQTVHMSQDQWDLHKLDSEYECVVRVAPNLTVINRKTSTTHPTSPSFTPIPSVKMAETTPTSKAKRPAPDAFPETPRKMRTPHRMRTNDTPATCPSVVMAESDEDFDVMMVDAEITSASSPKRGRKKRTARQPRQKASFTSFTASPSLRFGKRQLNDSHEADDLPHKKTRLHSPISQRRQFERKQAERLWKRKTQLQAKFYARKETLERVFWENHGVPAYVQETYYNHRTSESRASPFGSSEPSPEPSSDVDAPESEEEARMARIEESRRKLAELEKDKPLWEESKRRREAQESEELQRKQQKLKREAEEKERKRMEEIRKGRDDEPQLAPERETLLREKAQKMFVTSYRDMLGWGPEHAFQRYVHTADAFDKASFEKQRVTFASIPWPILNSSFSIEDIEWEAVESFFFTMQQGMSPADFKKLMVMSHRRFHPDKWCSRKILQNAEDDLERHLLLVAGNLVSQAITPIWEEVTGSH